MNKSLVSSLLGICAAALLFASLAKAEQRDLVTVHLDFAAQAGDKTLAAGDYQISEVETTSGIVSLIFRANHFTAVVAAARIENPNDTTSSKTELIFDRTGNNLNLNKINLEGRTYRYEIVKDVPLPLQ